MSTGPKALRHPVRRRIVRWLHRDFEPHLAAELSDDLGLDSRQLAYHGTVLAGQGIVRQFDGPDGHLIDSLVGDDPEVITVLLSTQAADGSDATGR
jgi:DNA-binding transcriptional ArsR family regulator